MEIELNPEESSESVEEYLEALWVSEEEEKPLAKIKWISEHLDVAPPSAVEILKKMEKQGYTDYEARKGVKLTKKGRKIARQTIRNHRLIETLMKKTLGQEVDEKVACGIEHHLTKEFADALCTELGHPRKCPHDDPIPKGDCCPD
ncbi:hypothetical protein AKJ48_02520 [candidate division MSBL1 archaeon SCGC-AAA261O19]|uniref:HTH dtxR-type domain-containing protein n=2 Tax=candidate division MSBL1 TaxID=215777 RepID=A0A133UYB9_9EURY|nr:hypothetical protein AKJ42_03620 [candidate division MSBL1 archaeon SCGC-AAA261C02]KXB04469.1 hypothetical protein AKJ48_02520 [candidate division MSBL1 archaeon SCGC-AAA261O19]